MLKLELWNSTISKLCRLSYMVIISRNFKALLSLLWLSQPTISKFCQTFTMNFFWIDNLSLYFFILSFLETSRNYIMSIISIIITFASNSTVLVSQNVIFFGFYMTMSRGVNKKTIPSASATSLSPIRFSPGLLLFYKKCLINFLLL